MYALIAEIGLKYQKESNNNVYILFMLLMFKVELIWTTLYALGVYSLI